MLVKERVIIEKPYEQYNEQPAPPPEKQSGKKSVPNYKLRKFLFVFAFLVGGTWSIISSGSLADQEGYNLVEDRAVLTELRHENEQIRLELARLKSPERIQRIAKQELGMSEAKTIYYQQARTVPAPTPQKQIQTQNENIVGMVEGFFKRIIS
ncbi:MAG: cell division protein FtsL [Selenomonadales bacterium]|nr:cell division protein FtsL [Selenomonadales bacterium]